LEFQSFESLFFFPLSIENLSNETIEIWRGFYILLKNFTPQICDSLLSSTVQIGIYPFKFICENSHLIFPQVKLKSFSGLVQKLEKTKTLGLVECMILFLKGLNAKSEKILAIFVNFYSIFISNITIWKESIQSLTRCSALKQKNFEAIEQYLLVILFRLIFRKL
jgi:hypothetical protein